MLLKQTGFNVRLHKALPAVFILTGQEPWQLEQFAGQIKAAWKQHCQDDSEHDILHITAANDWILLEEEANSYSLFSNNRLLDVRYDKKTLDAAGKAFFERYLAQPNPRCLILIRAPELPQKLLTGLAANERIHIMPISPPGSGEVKQWIIARLKALACDFHPDLPALIQQYNEGNLLACAQLLDKLALIAEPGTTLTCDDVQEQLINQCEYTLYELADACLAGDRAKALLLLRQSENNKTEATLVLWLLTQEIRLLLQLLPGTIPLRDKAAQLKIWSSRVALYQRAVGRYRRDTLQSLLSACCQLDSDIKTGQGRNVWQSFELIALTLCSGKQLGCFA